MCEASAYLIKNDGEELLLESVDTLEENNGEIKMVSLFGEQRLLRGRIKSLSLVNHKILLEEAE